MNVTLKNIKIHDDMSEGTLCFSANIYVDNKLVGSVKNQGRGGCCRYDWKDRNIEKQLKKWAIDQCPGVKFEQLDLVLIDMAINLDEENRLKRLCRNNVVFRLKSDEIGAYHTAKLPWTKEVKEKLLSKFGDNLELVYNEVFDGEPTE